MESIPQTIVKYAFYIGIGYALMVSAVFLLQRRLIYLPDREKPPGDRLRALQLRYWPSEVDFKGLISIGVSHPRGTVIIFHGNAGPAWQRDYFALALAPLDFRVILAEYPGYGGRSGKPSEANFVRDAKAIVKTVFAELGGPIYLMGESLGCGVAAAAAGDPTLPVEGLALITPWDSLARLAQSHYLYLPARWLIKDRFDSVANLRTFSRPVAVAVALDDTVIPNRHSMRLYDALTAPKKLWRFENAGHNNWPTHPKAHWWREVMAFVASDNPEALKTN